MSLMICMALICYATRDVAFAAGEKNSHEAVKKAVEDNKEFIKNNLEAAVKYINLKETVMAGKHLAEIDINERYAVCQTAIEKYLRGEKLSQKEESGLGLNYQDIALLKNSYDSNNKALEIDKLRFQDSDAAAKIDDRIKTNKENEDKEIRSIIFKAIDDQYRGTVTDEWKEKAKGYAGILK